MKQIQSGRSFVEMLGVLAVMGIISIGGLYGYTQAMKRHRANELLNEANKRAVMVASQFMAGKDPKDVNIDEFPTNTPYGNFINALTSIGNDKFKMTISGLDEETCQYMEELAGGAIRKIECKETTDGFNVEFTFNKDLSTEERASDFTTPETCKSPYKWCLGSGTTGQCSDKTDCCEGLVYDNVCQSCDPETGKLTDNYDSTCQTCENGEITNNYNLCQTCENGVISDKNNQCQECDSKTGIVTNIPDSPVTSCTITTQNDGTCQAGECVEIMIPNCPSGTTVKEGYTGNDALNSGKCVCTSWTENVCGVGYYCYFDDIARYTNDNDEDYYGAVTGVCAKAPTPTEINVKLSATETKKLYRYDGNKNWWTAASLCNTQHNGLIIPSDVGFDHGNTSGGTDTCAGDTGGVLSLSPACTINCACGKHNTTVCPGANSSIGCSSKGARCNCWKYLNRSSLLGKHYYWTQNAYQYDTENSRHVFVVGLYGEIGGVTGQQREASSNMYTLCK